MWSSTWCFVGSPPQQLSPLCYLWSDQRQIHAWFTEREKGIQTSTSTFVPLVGSEEPCESLFDTESEEAAEVDGGAGSGTASDFSDRLSLKVRSTTVMSDWLRISCVRKKNINLFYHNKVCSPGRLKINNIWKWLFKTNKLNQIAQKCKKKNTKNNEK